MSEGGIPVVSWHMGEGRDVQNKVGEYLLCCL